MIKPTIDIACKVCNDIGWVCEEHPDKAWDCCGAAGMPCRICNQEANFPPGTTTIFNDKGYLN